MSLNPAFDPDVLNYTLTTSNATNKVTATPTDEGASVEITVGATQIDNGASASWASGDNTLTIVVTNGNSSTIYTVTVTRE